MHGLLGDLSIDSCGESWHGEPKGSHHDRPQETLMPPVIRHRQLLDPRSLGDALAMLRDEESVMPLAGCTDVYVSLNFGTLKPTRFMNLWRLNELRGIDRHDGRLRIGALTTYTELIRSPLVNRALPMLVMAAREIGGRQIQHRGTIGGNVANASPAGDTLPVLAVADAAVELRSASGTREVPFRSFYTGYRQTVARPDEVIAAFYIAPVAGTQWFRKVGTRAAQAISKVVVAGVAGPAPRLAAGSVAPTVVRLSGTEAALARRATASDVERAVLDDIAPIDDVRSTAEYRRRVAANLVAQFVHETRVRVSSRRR
jgi:CO/xanthine dehydrogenase FAD-binding subunit